MSKDASNPFSRLNAKDFPSRSERDNSKKQHRPKTVVKNREAEAAVPDADAELFMQAMGENVRALPSAEKARARPVRNEGVPTATTTLSPRLWSSRA